MTNQVDFQFKFNQKAKALISLILGIVSSIPVIYSVIINLFNIPISMEESASIGFILSKEPLLAVIGLILGILGLKSTKKKFAIAGIVLCLIGLIVPLYYFLR
jgi:hypothetical protein